MAPIPWTRAVPLALAATLLGGCVGHGDFGRVEPSSINRYLGHDEYAQVPGFENRNPHAAHGTHGSHTSHGNHAAKPIPLTADESELRARAYTLAFTHAHDPSHDHWSEPNRFVSTPFRHDMLPDPRRYAAALASDRFRAPEGRINAIVDDIRADVAGMDAFTGAARAVFAADAVRLVEIERLRISEKTEEGVVLRVAENRKLVDDTMAALGDKIAGYELALGDAIVTGAQNVTAGASLELDNVKRRYARLEADMSEGEGRYAMNLPREPACLEPSIARPC